MEAHLMILEDFIISVYCLVDNELKNLIKDRPLRTRGFEPKLSDAEVDLLRNSYQKLLYNA